MLIYECDVCRCRFFNPLGIVEIPYRRKSKEVLPTKRMLMVCMDCGTKIVDAIEKIKEDIKNDMRSQANA